MKFERAVQDKEFIQTIKSSPVPYEIVQSTRAGLVYDKFRRPRSSFPAARLFLFDHLAAVNRRFSFPSQSPS